MATNPRIPPEQDQQPRLVPQAVTPRNPNPPGTGVPGVIVAITVAVVILGAILYYMPRAPKKAPTPAAAQLPVQPQGTQLQLSDLNMTMSPTGGSFYIDGRVMNSGQRAVTGAVATVSLFDKTEKAVANLRSPLEGMAAHGNSLAPDEFGADPLKPNDSRAFRIAVNQVPANWNHEMPQVQIADVTSE